MCVQLEVIRICPGDFCSVYKKKYESIKAIGNI